MLRIGCNINTRMATLFPEFKMPENLVETMDIVVYSDVDRAVTKVEELL